MPKERLSNTRKVNRRIFIICEGEKTEPDYFAEIIDERPIPGDIISIIIERTKKNTCRELVEHGTRLKETPRDQVWVVVDKDGYTKHPESFDKARSCGIKIAFSSISFEFWILLHFEYTSKCFTNSDKVISYINKKNFFAPEKFKKNLPKLYGRFLKLNSRTETAIKNAKLLATAQQNGNPGKPIYSLNPYTDVHTLIKAIRDVQKEFGY